MEGFLWGLLAAYIAAILFVAYDKPSFYLDHLDGWAFLGPILAAVLIALWNGGADTAFTKVRDLIPAEKLSTASDLVSEAQAPMLMFFICSGLLLVGLLASFLASKMQRHLAGSKR